MLAALLAIVAAGVLAARAAREVRRGDAPLEARVQEVIDGDTVRVRLPSGRVHTVRYIGIDTPETPPGGAPECFGPEATAANRRLVAGERVRLVTDAERRDRYGRLLAYVYRSRDDLLVNAELLRAGAATVLSIPPNVRHADRFSRIAERARRERRGLWAACDVTST